MVTLRASWIYPTLKKCLLIAEVFPRFHLSEEETFTCFTTFLLLVAAFTYSLKFIHKKRQKKVANKVGKPYYG